MTQWGKGPLVLGGYSRVAVGHHDVRQAFEPIANTIFLAGEAYGARLPQTGRNWETHMAGAAISGELAAKLVIEQLRETAQAQGEKKKLVGKIVSSVVSRKQQGGYSL